MHFRYVCARFRIFINNEKSTLRYSCEIDGLVESHLCKLCV